MQSPEDGQQRRIGGRYLLSAHLGSGAMGTVWSGYDEVLQRRVAIKELKIPPGVPAHEARDMRERIMREARALGGLSHPNVITVFDVVVVDGAPVVVLEMVPSRDLATMISEHGALSMPQAAVIGFTTAGALRAAHRSGITHRDVKPGNVLVADDGRVKLTDFGIARNIADAPMTSVGLVLGSPAYIAPEVAAGQPVTTAADLWGLGATLFAAIEGRPPYDVQGDPVRTITEVVDGAVPRPRGAGPVVDVIAALMVKDPDRRMPLEEVRRRLRPLILDPDDPVYPGSPDAPTMASPITLAQRNGVPPRRPGTPVDTGPPSLVKGERAGPAASRPSTGTGGHPRPSTGTGGHPRPSTGTGGHPRPGTGTGGHPRPGGGAEPGAGARPDTATPAPPAPLAADPGPLPAGIRASSAPPTAPANAGGSSAGARPATATPSAAARAGTAGPTAAPPGWPRPSTAAPPAGPRPSTAAPPAGPRPSTAAPPAGPRPSTAAPPSAQRPAAPPPSGARSPAPALAAAPGPLPPELHAAAGPGTRPDTQPAPAGASGLVAAGLVIAGAAVVLAGIAAGWVVTRTVSGESPFSTVTVSTTQSR